MEEHFTELFTLYEYIWNKQNIEKILNQQKTPQSSPSGVGYVVCSEQFAEN